MSFIVLYRLLRKELFNRNGKQVGINLIAIKCELFVPSVDGGAIYLFIAFHLSILLLLLLL